MRIAVSACLLGENCKYSGGNNRNQRVIDFVRGHEVIPVCPELAAGMPAPRPPVELKNGRAVQQSGADVDEIYREGVRRTMAQLAETPVALAILQPRSPTCGVRRVYDGSFTGRLIPGEGLLARALREAGIPTAEPDDL